MSDSKTVVLDLDLDEDFTNNEHDSYVLYAEKLESEGDDDDLAQEHEQPVADLVDCGTLISEEGDDMDIVGVRITFKEAALQRFTCVLETIKSGQNTDSTDEQVALLIHSLGK